MGVMGYQHTHGAGASTGAADEITITRANGVSDVPSRLAARADSSPSSPATAACKLRAATRPNEPSASLSRAPRPAGELSFDYDATREWHPPARSSAFVLCSWCSTVRMRADRPHERKRMAQRSCPDSRGARLAERFLREGLDSENAMRCSRAARRCATLASSLTRK